MWVYGQMQDWVGVRPRGVWSASLERSDSLATLSMFACVTIYILVRWYICRILSISASAYLAKCTDSRSHDVPVSHLDLHSAGVKHLTTFSPQTPHSPLLQQFMIKGSGLVLCHGRAGNVHLIWLIIWKVFTATQSMEIALVSSCSKLLHLLFHLLLDWTLTGNKSSGSKLNCMFQVYFWNKQLH